MYVTNAEAIKKKIRTFDYIKLKKKKAADSEPPQAKSKYK